MRKVWINLNASGLILLALLACLASGNTNAIRFFSPNPVDGGAFGSSLAMQMVSPGLYSALIGAPTENNTVWLFKVRPPFMPWILAIAFLVSMGDLLFI